MRTVFVTGAASGIGRATAEKFASFGDLVIVADINETGGQETVEIIRNQGGSAEFQHLDIRDQEAIEVAIDRTLADRSAINVLCNNAADMSLLAVDDHLLNTDIDVISKSFQANALSAVIATKRVLPGMLDAGKGAIINVSSVDGLSGDDCRFGYALSKSALDMFSKMVATKYGQAGIVCNTVAPGLVLTPTANAALTPEVVDAFKRNVLSPQHGAAPEQVAGLIAFLASSDAAYINGETIRVDGGLLSHVTHLDAMHRIFESATQ